MVNFSIDYSQLSLPEQKPIRFEDVRHRLEKIAFDVYKFKDGDPDELWQVQADETGSNFIIARYTEEAATEKLAKIENDWDVLVSESSGRIDIFYKNRPITKLASKDIGIKAENLKYIQYSLPKKLATDKNLVKELLNMLPSENRKNILTQYPELG